MCHFFEELTAVRWRYFTHLAVDVLGVQTVIIVVDLPLNHSLVPGADCHDDQHRFLSESKSCYSLSSWLFGIFETLLFQLALTHVVQKSVHPSVDGHPSDRVVNKVSLPRHKSSISITNWDL